MQLIVDGEAITINIGELEREDARNIEYAVEAVRAAKLRDRTPVTA
jgi:hydroxyethylthiazole kinase-like sugar kinase family protein